MCRDEDSKGAVAYSELERPPRACHSCSDLAFRDSIARVAEYRHSDLAKGQ